MRQRRLATCESLMMPVTVQVYALVSVNHTSTPPPRDDFGKSSGYGVEGRNLLSACLVFEKGRRDSRLRGVGRPRQAACRPRIGRPCLGVSLSAASIFMLRLADPAQTLPRPHSQPSTSLQRASVWTPLVQGRRQRRPIQICNTSSLRRLKSMAVPAEEAGSAGPGVPLLLAKPRSLPKVL